MPHIAPFPPYFLLCLLIVLVPFFYYGTLLFVHKVCTRRLHASIIYLSTSLYAGTAHDMAPLPHCSDKTLPPLSCTSIHHHHHIVPYRITSHHITSHHITLYHITSHHHCHHHTITTTSPHSRALRNARLDVLVYPEVGIDPVTYYLSFARLAPVQVITTITTMTQYL